jgi:hypothetical protein
MARGAPASDDVLIANQVTTPCTEKLPIPHFSTYKPRFRDLIEAPNDTSYIPPHLRLSKDISTINPRIVSVLVKECHWKEQ